MRDTVEIIGSDGADRGGVVVVHGLNNRAEVMDPLIDVLTTAGLVCARVDLHTGTRTARRDPRAIGQDWTARVEAGRRALRDRVPGRPLHGLGHSLGALVLLEAARRHQRPTARDDALVLLAPPLALTRTATGVRVLRPLARLGLGLPSLAPRRARARRFTPLSEYQALLGLRASLTDAEGLEHTTARLLLEERDELVDADGVRTWVHDHPVPGWSVDTLAARTGARWPYRHLIVAPEDVGPEAWEQITTVMLQAFGAAAPRERAPVSVSR